MTEDSLSANYVGPSSLTSDVETALATLADRLAVVQQQCKSHSVLSVTHFGDDTSLRATAVYLVAAIAYSVEANLAIREALFDEADRTEDLERDVASVIGDGGEGDDFKTSKRDPWMWEAISHMLIHLSRRNAELHPRGEVLAKSSIKHDVNDHGLDMVAIYQSGHLGVSAGECKAYLNDPSRGITDASNRLAEIEANKRDPELRSTVSQLASALAEDSREGIAGAFWRNERSYLPFVCCDEAESPDWARNRQVLGRIDLPVECKILYPMPLENARCTLDRLGELMHEYIGMQE